MQNENDSLRRAHEFAAAFHAAVIGTVGEPSESNEPGETTEILTIEILTNEQRTDSD